MLTFPFSSSVSNMADRETPLKFRDEIGWLGRMECPRRNEEHVVCLEWAVFRHDGRAFDDWQDIPLHALTGNVRPARLAFDSDFIDLIEEHDAAVF